MASATRTAMIMKTTEAVVARPTPSAPPRVKQAHVHGDERDDEAEHQRLHHRIEEVVAVPEEPRAVEEGSSGPGPP